MQLNDLYLASIPDPGTTITQDDAIEVALCGIVRQITGDESTCDVLAIARQALAGSLDFNILHGCYRMLIHDKAADTFLFFGDNAGTQLFYIDWENRRVSNSLLRLADARGDALRPNYLGISQLFKYARIFTQDTIVAGITASDFGKVYTLIDGSLREKSKHLTPFWEKRPLLQLSQLISELTGAMEPSQLCAVITGGTDSRTVLAHLAHAGIQPPLVLTGHADNPDIPIARKIARLVDAPLTVLDPKDREDDWLTKGYRFADGCGCTVLAYRHCRKAEWAAAHGYRYEFGGVGGEFYKNAFCHPFRYGYFLRRITDQVLYDAWFQASQSTPRWFGKSMRDVVGEEQRALTQLCRKNNNGTLLCRCNSLGYDALQKAYSTVSNRYADYCTKIDPLVDRDIVAGVCDTPVLRLSMQRWQRKQIHEAFPALSDIETDQGRSCSVEPLRLLRESLRELQRYGGLAIGRIKRKLGIGACSEPSYWRDDYAAAMTSPLYREAVDACKRLGILSADISPDSLPADRCGEIITVGLLFGRKGKA